MLDHYLSLDVFAHSSLWKKEEPIWHPLHILRSYLESLDHKIKIDLHPGVFLENKEMISIGEGSVIEPGASLQGPCVIGKNCVIKHGAYLRGNVLCGNGVHIGHGSEVKHSILLDGAHATHFVYVGDSILGNGVNLGAGVKCANLRLDREEISARWDGKKTKTGLKKFGAIVGDRSQIGCNSVFNPGTLLGKESFSFPLVSIHGSIPPQSQIDANGIKPIEQKLLKRLLWTSHSPARL